MSGETEQRPSGWTVDTLKEYLEARLQASSDLSSARLSHLMDLRAADVLLSASKEKYDDAHFEQLNRNAERTIEERGHFVTHEANDPFMKQVLEYMAGGAGNRKGVQEVIGYVLAAAATIIAIISFVVR